MPKPGPQTVFLYTDYRQFLRDWLTEKKTDKRFSLRGFAKRAGFRTPHIMQLVSGGHRNLTAESILKFARGLRLSKEETRYFEDLVHFNQAHTPQEQAHYYTRLVAHPKRSKALPIEKGQLSFFRSWEGPVLYEMTQLPDFRPDPKAIAARFDPPVSAAEVKSLMNDLVASGLADAQGGKFLIRAETLDTGDNVRDLHLYAYHENALVKAADALPKPQDQRYFQVTTAAVSSDVLPELVRLAKEFESAALQLIENSPRPKDQVMQISLQIFPCLHQPEQSAKVKQ